MESQPLHIAVIGGGPAGMMAAGRAAALGARVTLYEKNGRLGEKLLITGGGRCNIFNAEFNTHKLVEKYGKKGKALFSVFSQFDVQATLDFFEERGLKIKVEAEQRAFPQSERAADVRQTMAQFIKAGNVKVILNEPVIGLEAEGDMITKIYLDGKEVTADRYIVTTGGKSRPETGSTGDGFVWMKNLGHTVIEPDPALVPVTLQDAWTKGMSGISLKDVRLTVQQNGVKQDTKIGKMLFTHVGISGPLVLNMSKKIGELLKIGSVMLSLDLFPSLDLGTVDQLLLDTFEKGKNKMIKNNIGKIVQPRLAHALLAIAKVPADTPLYQLTREDRLAFARLLKDIPLRVEGLLGEDKAIVTGGGVSLKEVEFKTMQSKLYKNLYLAGDILDFDRPSGGFSLQICWTTGFVAGSNATMA